MCRRTSGRRPRIRIPATTRGPSTRAGCQTTISDRGRGRRDENRAEQERARSAAPEDVLELVRGRLVELVVAALARRLVGAPALELGGVTEPRALEVLECDLADQTDADRLPGQVLAAIPPAGRAREALCDLLVLPLRPVAPGMLGAGAVAQRLELLRELGADRARERGGHADVMEHGAVVVEAEQQRADEGALAALVPAEAADDAVRGALVLDLEHHALARGVGELSLIHISEP